MLTGSRRHAPVRWAWLALVTAQTLAFAFAPLADSRAERGSAQPAYERAHGDTCTPVHRASACLFCQAVGTRAVPPCSSPAPVAVVLRERGAGPGPLQPPTTRSSAVRSRAPPFVG